MRVLYFLLIISLSVLSAQSVEARLKKLLADLKNKDEFIRHKAIKEMSRMIVEEGADPKKIVPSIVPSLSDPAQTVSLGASRALGYIAKEKPNEVLPHLTKALKHHDIGVRMELSRILIEIGGELVVAPISEVLLKDTSVDVRYSVIRLMVKMSQEKPKDALLFVETFCTLLKKDKKWDVRVGAAESLSILGESAKSSVPTLGEVFQKDNHEGVRKMCAKALGNMGEAAKEYIPLFFETLNDKKAHEKVRVGVVSALISLEEITPEVITVATELLQSSMDIVILDALEALKYTGSKGKEAIPMIAKLIERGGKFGPSAEEAYMGIMNKRYR